MHRSSPLRSVRTLVLLAAFVTAATAHASPPLRYWNSATTGFWSGTGNWTPTGQPAGGDSVVVPLSVGAHTLTLDLDSPGLAYFQQLNPGGTFDLAGHTLYPGNATFAGTVTASAASQAIYGPFTTLAGSQVGVVNGAILNLNNNWQNGGHVVVHSTAGSTATSLRLTGYQTLSGSGDVLLNDAANALFDSPSGYILTHNAGHQIHGAGRITLAFTNHGTVTADLASGATLSIENSSTSNDGTFRATNGAKLLLDNAVTNTGGLLFADGGNIELNGTSVSNGLLHTTGSSVIETMANSSMQGALDLSGTLQVNSGHVLSFGNTTLADSGQVLVHPSGAAASAFRLAGYVTLDGPGNLLLGDAALASLDSPSNYTLTQNASHTVHGAGLVSVPLTNHGTFSADASGQVLTLSNNVGNDGTLRATGGILALQGATVSNTGSVLASGGDVRLTNESINGGIVQASGGSMVSVVSGTNYLYNVTTAGTIQVASGAILNTQGAIANSGVFQVRPPAGASTATLRLNNYATYTGTGAIQLTHATQSVLDSPSGYTITQTAGHTLHGTGMVTLPVTNHGMINADVAGQPLTLTNNITSDGTLQATGGTLVLQNSTLNLTSGTLKANGGNVQLSGETVNFGSLSRSGSNLIEIAGTSSFYNVTTSSLLQIDGGASLNAYGAIPNTGTIVVRPSGGTGAASLSLPNYLTVSGAGAIQLTDAAQSSIVSPASYTLTNAVDHTIHGTGQTTLPLTNHGLVSADVAGQPLTMTSTLINDGTLQATGYGTLVLTSASLNNTGGTLAANGGNVTLSGVTFGGGKLTSAPANAIVITGSSTLYTNTTNAGLLKVNGGALLTCNNLTFADSGTVQFRSPADTAAATFRLTNYVTVGGTGAFVLTHGSQSIIDSPASYSLTNAAPHTIRGAGLITCPFANTGTIVADVKDSLLRVTNSTLTHTGIQAAANGGTLVFGLTPGNLSGFTLSFGTWQPGAYSKVQLPAADVRTLAAAVVLDGPGSDLWSADSSVSALRRLGTIVTGGNLTVRNGRTFFPIGDLTVSHGTVGVGPGALLVVGSVAPHNVAADTNATFVVELSAHGATGCGKLVVYGTLAVPGHLTVRALDGFQANLADTFEVADFTARSGDFVHLDSVMVAPHIMMVPVWQTGRLLLVAKTSYGTTDVPPTPAPGPVQAPATLAFAAHGGAGGTARLELALPHAALVDVSVFDVSGRRVATLAHDAFGAGRTSWSWGIANGQPSGIYFARAQVTTNGTTRTLDARLVVWR